MPASAGDTGDMGSIWVNSWVGKIPWRRAWQPTPVFFPGKIPWTEEPGRLKSIVHKESDTTEVTEHTAHSHSQVRGGRQGKKTQVRGE